MNNLLIGKDKLTDEIIVENKSQVNLLDIDGRHKTNIILKDNSSLTLNIFSKKNLELNINVTLNNNTKLIINSSFINTDKHKEIIDVKIKGSNNEVNINSRGINNGDTVEIILNGDNDKFAKNNSFSEYAKVINNTNSQNILIPNLLVSNYNVTFNHGVSIGHIREKNIFYLESKGIDRKKALKLLEQGFILSIMKDDIKEELNPILKED